eukprot:SAG22_NODE_3_length_48349_cov_158.681180_13_plen_343_part_00
MVQQPQLAPAARRRVRRLAGHMIAGGANLNAAAVALAVAAAPPAGGPRRYYSGNSCCSAPVSSGSSFTMAAGGPPAPGHPCFVGEPEKAAFRQHGFHVLPAMLSLAEIEQAVALFESAAAQGGGLRNLLDREEGLLSVAAHPALLAAVHAILTPRPQLLQYDGIDQRPGSNDQTFHSDFSFFSSGVTLMLNVGVYLDGLTEANGPIWVVAGSHHQPKHGRGAARDGVFPLPPPNLRTRDVAGSEPVHCPPGSAVLFDCCLWHHGGGNRLDSGQRRRAVFPTYGHYWMKRFEQWMPLPQRERWPDATAEELELLGVELRGDSEYGGYTETPIVRKDLKGEWME